MLIHHSAIATRKDAVAVVITCWKVLIDECDWIKIRTVEGILQSVHPVSYLLIKIKVTDSTQ